MNNYLKIINNNYEDKIVKTKNVIKNVSLYIFSL